ncbi:MAG TPA: hypothetical protein VK778_14160 [Solirubrobacteraceae bacterium]|nr:hypothetical protein [Solirubrobacteraceae bacterium]
MLHIATVHYGSPRWIEIQKRYLREHISVPYQTWTSLNQIDPAYSAHFDRVIDQTGRHSDKLNHLAIEIAHEASDSDLLMFLDADAFPIADPMPAITDGLANAALIAVRRAENNGDRQPHPCFCVTTVGAWRKLGGDWSPGYRWSTPQGRRVSDVGGNLLRQLELTQTPWVPLLRSNRRSPDPILFSVYADIVYHHGAGSRAQAFTRGHNNLAPTPLAVPNAPVVGEMVKLANRGRRRVWRRSNEKRQARESQRVYDRIRSGGSDWLSEFM